jgi:Uma2 family endonuclease
MTIAIPIDAIQLAPGNTLSIHNLSWQDFETILTDLGETRSTRIAYYQGTLEIQMLRGLRNRNNI